MSNTYLDRFRSALPTVQGNQILKILTSKRDSGEIKSVNEFRDKLRELTSKILAERITPTFKLFQALAGVDTSSAQYNDMLDHIQDDLEAAFIESDNIDNIIAAHHNLINDVALKALRFGINELESKVSLYEFLNKSTQGFDDAMFNTFRESLNHITSRSESAASLVYIDPTRGTFVDSAYNAEVDLIGERLILGAESKEYLSIREAKWFSNANSVRSELDVAFRNSRISNIIDRQKNTYWVEPILVREVRDNGVPMEICLGMKASQDVNFIEIEPASNFPMILVGVDYFDSNNIRRTATSNEVSITGPVRINFERITTKQLIVRVRQDNYREIQFKRKPGESNFHRAVLRESSNTIDIESVNSDLNDLLTSDFILTNVMGLQEPATVQLKYFEYLLGFDNIRAGFNTFRDLGIYVSEVKKVSKPGQIALRIDEVRPTQVAGSAEITLDSHQYPTRSDAEDNKFYHSAVEYWAIAQFYAEDDFLISTDSIPLLPLGAERIYHEQLIFTGTSSGATNPNVSQLRFFTQANNSDVLVYRNATLLNHGTDWTFLSNTDALGLTVTVPGAGKPMKRAIKIEDTVQPLDIYTVSYTPTLSNTHTIIPANETLLRTVDLLGDQGARLVAGNVIVFENTRLAHIVDYAQFYLLILMRRNSAEQNLSPAVEEYMIVTGSRDAQRFVSD